MTLFQPGTFELETRSGYTSNLFRISQEKDQYLYTFVSWKKIVTLKISLHITVIKKAMDLLILIPAAF